MSCIYALIYWAGFFPYLFQLLLFFFLSCFVDLRGSLRSWAEFTWGRKSQSGRRDCVWYFYVVPSRCGDQTVAPAWWTDQLAWVVLDLWFMTCICYGHIIFWLDKVATHTDRVQMSRVPWQYIIQEQQQLKSLKLVGGTVADLRLGDSGWRNLDTSWKHTQ